MQAVIYHAYRAPLTLETLPDPRPAPRGVVLAVKATGLCRSDWHGWMGHDPDIRLPHVPGHELAGVVAAVGREVRGWRVGDRVTVPFVGGCGSCPECHAGHQQVCPDQFQPGFTHWGAFAEYVAIDYADTNLVRLPDFLDDVTAASLGCRFATSFRAVVDQGRLRPGEWVAIHGCGGVGLSALQIARAVGARVIAVDIGREQLALATRLGADHAIDATTTDVVAAIRSLTGGGAHLSLDALGHPATLHHSIMGLRRRGRHVQVGLLAPEALPAPVPMDRVIAYELELYGSHGMQAHRYPALLALIGSGRLDPRQLVSRTIGLEEVAAELPRLADFAHPGMTVAKIAE